MTRCRCGRYETVAALEAEGHGQAWQAVPGALASEVEASVDADGVLLFHRETGRCCQLNLEAAAILSCCDGQATVQGIAKAIGAAVGRGPAALESDVIEVVTFLTDQGMLHAGTQIVA